MADCRARRCAPDGCYRWLVVAASFFMQLVLSSIAFCVGVFFVMFQKNLGGSSWLVSIVSSLNTSIFFAIGPVAGAATQHFGCRPVALAGGLIGSVGLALNMFVTETWQLLITFGIISGFGMGLCYIPAITIVSQYFPPERRTFAMGVAVCGLGAGSVVFPPVLRWMERTYAWRGAMLLTTGLFLHTLLFACIFRPPPPESSEGFEEEEERRRRRWKERKERAEEVGQEADPALSTELKAEVVVGGSTTRREVEDRLLTEVGEIENGTAVVEFEKPSSTTRGLGGCDPQLHIAVLNNIGFNLFLLLNVLFSIGLSVVMVHIGACGVAKGFSADRGAMLVFAMGLGSTTSRPIYGLLAQVRCIGAARAMAVAMSLCGLATAVYPLVPGFEGMAACSALVGFFMGSYGSLPPIVTIDLVGVDLLASGYGYVCVADGIGILIGGAVSGTLYEATSNYIVPFAIGGAMMTASGILGAIIWVRFYTGQPCCGSRQHAPSYTTQVTVLKGQL